MISAQTRFIKGRNWQRGVSLPDMAPFAGIVFTVACFYLGTSSFKTPAQALVKLEQQPSSTWVRHGKRGESPLVTIGLNQLNQVSFAADRAIQQVVIGQLMRQHGITLNAAQLSRLQDLPYLATDIQKLPKLLALPGWQQQRQFLTGQPNSLTEAQLVQRIATTLALMQSHSYGYLRINLSIDAQVPASLVLRITDLLQAQGINRFYLSSQGKSLEEIPRGT